MTRKVAGVLGLVLFLVASVVATAAAQVDSNDIMGFETTAGWTISTSAAPPGTTVFSTPIRTQGSAAYGVTSPVVNLIKLISQPVSSTATALAGIGEAGAQFRLDVLIPNQQGNQV